MEYLPALCAAVVLPAVLWFWRKPTETKSKEMRRKQERLNSLNFDPNTFQFNTIDEWLDKWNENCFCYHAHIYYRNETEKENARELRNTFKKWTEEGLVSCDIGPLLDKPGNGPHTWSYLEVQIWDSDYYPVLRHLQFHHKTNPVLVHPVSVRHLENHTNRALWLGDPQPIKEDFLKKFDTSVVNSLMKVIDDRNALIQDTYINYSATKYGIKPEEVTSFN